MEKIFKVRMKIWLWHSGPLKFAGVGKVFVKGPLFTLFIKKKMCFKIKIFVLNQQQGAQIIWKKYLKFERNSGFGTVAC